MKGIIATTHVDKQREKIALSALEGMVEQMEGRAIPVNVEHDPRMPPMGVMHKARLVPLDDGEHGVEAESLIWETAEDLAEVAALGLEFAPSLPAIDEMKLVLDHSYYSDAEQLADAQRFCDEQGLECGYFGKKAVEPLSQLTIIAGSFVAGAIASGFFGSIGSDAYNALKTQISKMLKRNSSKGDKLVVFQFVLQEDGHDCLVEILLENPLDADFEWFGSEGIEQLTTLLSRLAPERDGAKQVLIVRNGQRLKISYGINKNGLPLKFKEVGSDAARDD